MQSSERTQSIWRRPATKRATWGSTWISMDWRMLADPPMSHQDGTTGSDWSVTPSIITTMSVTTECLSIMHQTMVKITSQIWSRITPCSSSNRPWRSRRLRHSSWSQPRRRRMDPSLPHHNTPTFTMARQLHARRTGTTTATTSTGWSGRRQWWMQG